MLFAATLLVVAPCAPQAPQHLAPQSAPAPALHGAQELPSETEPVLRIDDEAITWGEYSRWLIRTLGERRAREFALEFWVVEREAARRQIEVAPAETLAHVQRDLDLRIQNAFFGRKQDWLEELARTGRSEAGVRAERGNEARIELLASAMANVERVVPEHKIVRDWERIYGRHGKHYDVSMMKFKVEVVAPEGFTRDKWKQKEQESKDAARARALEARTRLVAGEDFARLAAQLSDDSDTRIHRGTPAAGFRDPGWPWNFLDALEALAPHEISQPLYAKGGWWLVRVESVKETPLASVRKELELALIAAGPEPDEFGAVQQRLKEGVTVKTLPGMWADGPSGERPDMLDPVMAVDGEPVTKGEYARWLCQMQGEPMAGGFVECWLVQKRARELGITVTLAEAEERAQAYIDELVATNSGGSREAWIEYMKLGSRDPEALFREYTYRSLTDVLVEKMILSERKVPPAEVRRYFEEVYGKEGERFEVRMIVRHVVMEPLEDNLSREQLDHAIEAASQKTKDELQALRERVHGGEDFAALARAESQEPHSAAAGGLLGERFRSDRWSDEVFQQVSKAHEGELVGPLRQGMSVFLFQVVTRRKVAFDDVSKELEHELLTRRPSFPEVLGYRNALAQHVHFDLLPGLSK